MSNLGWYQKLTTLAKLVGGPRKLVALLVGGGAVAGTGLTIGTQKIIERAKKHKNKKDTETAEFKIHNITKNGESNEGYEFRVGDKYRVVEIDGDSGLIVINENEDDPRFVSMKFISSISDYEC